MRVLAEIRWCGEHKRLSHSGKFGTRCGGWLRYSPCGVVDAQVTHTTTDPTPRPYNQPCPICDGTGDFWTAGTEGSGPMPSSSWVSCPSCAVCADCGGTGLIHDGYWPCSHKSCGDGLPCPSCAVCPDCGGTGQTGELRGGTGLGGTMGYHKVPCPSCSVGTEQTEQNTSEEARIWNAAERLTNVPLADLTAEARSEVISTAREAVAAYRGTDE